MNLFTEAWQLPTLTFAAGFLLARLIYGTRPRPDLPPRDDISDVEIEAELRTGSKVAAIKLCRQKYGYDLKTAVDHVNAVSARLALRT